MDDLSMLIGHVMSERFGLNISSLGRTMVGAAISSRKKSLKMSPASYAAHFSLDGQEQVALHQMLLVSESWIHRELESIDAVVRILAARQSSIVTLSTPCARGEEPVSVMESAFRAGLDPLAISVHGYDASEKAIEQAQSYCFSSSAFRGNSRLESTEMFTQFGTGWSLQPRFRNCLHFEQADLLSPHWVPKSHVYDIILCRNLLIYLHPDAQRQLLSRLLGFLSPQGFLVVAAAEASILSSLPVQHTDFHQAVFTTVPTVSVTNNPCASVSRVRLPRDIVRPPRVVRHETCEPSSSRDDTMLETIEKLADGGQLLEAYSAALEYLEENPSSYHAQFLLGMIASASGNMEQALHWMYQVISLSPDHEGATVFLQVVGRSSDQPKEVQ